jgi:hypothetical protein
LPLIAVAAQEDREGKRYGYPPNGESPVNGQEGRAVAGRVTVEDPVLQGEMSSQLAYWVLIDQQAQLDIARFAQRRAMDDPVYDFIGNLIDEYRSAVRRLGPLAGAEGRIYLSGRISGPVGIVAERQRRVATSTDEVYEKSETVPVSESPTGAPGTGQETGATGTRARDVRQGETGSDNARTITEPLPRRSRTAGSLGPAEVGTRGRRSVAGTTSDEVRARDRRLDAFDRVGTLPVSEQNRRADAEVEDTSRVRVQAGAERVRPGVVIRPGDIVANIGSQRLELAKRELSRFSGASFDREFLHHQIAAHLYSLSLMRGLHGNVDSELQELLDDLERVNWSNLSRAREIAQMSRLRD